MKIKHTVPYPNGLGNQGALNTYPVLNDLGKLHNKGLALIEKLGELKYSQKDVCLKEWLEFIEAFEEFFKPAP